MGSIIFYIIGGLIGVFIVVMIFRFLWVFFWKLGGFLGEICARWVASRFIRGEKDT